MICATLPIRRSLLRRIAAGSATLLTSIASAIPGDGGPFDEIGLTALLERLAPERVPTGAPFELFAINPTSTAGAYGPDQSHPELVPMDFVQWGGPPGIFDFVTDRTIELCGAETGIAPGLDAVWIKDWLAWFNSLTPNDAVAPPASHPTQVDIVSVNTPMTWGTAIGNNTALRKIDWLALSQEQLWVASAGANVGPTIQYPVAFCGYNTLAVGGSGGDHQHGTVPPGLDGAGRRKPDLVGPVNGFVAMSYVSACASLLYSTTLIDPGVGDGPGSYALPIRAVLLASTTHRPGWTNGAPQSGPNRGIATTPVDATFGTDLLNVDRAHETLTGGRQVGSASVPAAVNISRRGWDVIPAPGPNSSKFYRFRVQNVADELSVVATWQRYVNFVFALQTVMSVDISLSRVDESGALQPLTGPNGVAYFQSGNVVSASPNYNLEHIYVRGLEPGEYVLDVHRNAGTDQATFVGVAWWMTKTGPVGDLDQDGTVGAADLALLLGGWSTGRESDLDRDGLTGASDLGVLLGAWSE